MADICGRFVWKISELLLFKSYWKLLMMVDLSVRKQRLGHLSVLRQAIIWTDGGLVHSRIYASLRLYELIQLFKFHHITRGSNSVPHGTEPTTCNWYPFIISPVCKLPNDKQRIEVVCVLHTKAYLVLLTKFALNAVVRAVTSAYKSKMTTSIEAERTGYIW